MAYRSPSPCPHLIQHIPHELGRLTPVQHLRHRLDRNRVLPELREFDSNLCQPLAQIHNCNELLGRQVDRRRHQQPLAQDPRLPHTRLQRLTQDSFVQGMLVRDLNPLLRLLHDVGVVELKRVASVHRRVQFGGLWLG